MPRFAIMVPQNNTTMEVEFPRYVGPQHSYITLKVPRGVALLTPETLPAYKQSAIDLARGIRGQVDVLAYGCTAAGFMMGAAEEASLAQALAEASGAKVVTTARAMASVLEDEGARRVDVVTPYGAALNAQLTKFLESFGIAVSTLESIPVKDTIELGKVTEETVRDYAERALTRDGDAVFVACSQLPSYGFLSKLQANKPVWASIKATAAMAARMASPAAEDLATAR